MPETGVKQRFGSDCFVSISAPNQTYQAAGRYSLSQTYYKAGRFFIQGESPSVIRSSSSISEGLFNDITTVNLYWSIVCYGALNDSPIQMVMELDQQSTSFPQALNGNPRGNPMVTWVWIPAKDMPE